MSMIHQITGTVPRYKRRTRKGRGESSGHGKTCGRGTKGAKARQGKPYWKPGHEGGQTPLHRRLPTRGFSNDDFRTRWHIVNVRDLGRFPDGAVVDSAALIAAGLVPDDKCPVKVLGDGPLERRLTVQVASYSRSAVRKIESAGGVAQNTSGQAFAFPKPRRPVVKAREEQARSPKAGKSGKVAAAEAQATTAESEAPAAN
jgi:large subunit ribosomal protein L15